MTYIPMIIIMATIVKIMTFKILSVIIITALTPLPIMTIMVPVIMVPTIIKAVIAIMVTNENVCDSGDECRDENGDDNDHGTGNCKGLG